MLGRSSQPCSRRDEFWILQNFHKWFTVWKYYSAEVWKLIFQYAVLGFSLAVRPFGGGLSLWTCISLLILMVNGCKSPYRWEVTSLLIKDLTFSRLWRREYQTALCSFPGVVQPTFSFVLLFRSMFYLPPSLPDVVAKFPTFGTVLGTALSSTWAESQQAVVHFNP